VNVLLRDGSSEITKKLPARVAQDEKYSCKSLVTDPRLEKTTSAIESMIDSPFGVEARQ